VPLTQDISLLLKDAEYVLRVYADPIASHALQIYQSVLATVPSCKLLHHAPIGRVVPPRLVSERASDWNSVLQMMEGHVSGVSSVACSIDGGRVASGSIGSTVRVWDMRMGQRLIVLEGHHGLVHSVAFSPDGAYIVSGSNDNTVRVWDAQAGIQLAIVEAHGKGVRSVAFSPDAARIVSGSADKTVCVWDARTGRQLAVMKGHRSIVVSVAFSTDGMRVVSGLLDKTVRVWNAQTGKQLAVLKVQIDWVQSVAFSSDGKRAISRNRSGHELAWDASGAVHLGEQFQTRVCSHCVRCSLLRIRKGPDHPPAAWRHSCSGLGREIWLDFLAAVGQAPFDASLLAPSRASRRIICVVCDQDKTQTRTPKDRGVVERVKDCARVRGIESM
jgi:hypothetical protein